MIAAIALTLAVRGAAAQPLPRIEAAIELGVQSFQSSDYGEVLSAFDHAPLRWGFQANAHVLRVLTPRLRVGGRAGYLHTSSSSQGSSPGAAAEPLVVNLGDLGATLRVVVTNPRATGLSVDLGLDVGMLVGSIDYRNVGQLVVAPRIAPSLFVGYARRPRGLLLGARVGYVAAPWDGAGGSGWDPVFSGFSIGVEAGVDL